MKSSIRMEVRVVCVTQRDKEPRYLVDIAIERMPWKSLPVDYPISLPDAMQLACTEWRLSGNSFET